MAKHGALHGAIRPTSEPEVWLRDQRTSYETATSSIRDVFNAHLQELGAGLKAIEGRAAAVDRLIAAVWQKVFASSAALMSGMTLMAVGGYGRRELFPFSDVDLMFLLDASTSEKKVKEPIRHINQLLWDAGLRVSAMTRSLAECEKFDPENVEFTLSLLDARFVAGDAALAERLIGRSLPRLVARDARKISARLLMVTRTRHARYGDTLFHLEPNIKECPGGLRDAHVCGWLARLSAQQTGVKEQDLSSVMQPQFVEAHQFLILVRLFLHLRHLRDDNTLDWQAQDAAGAASLGTGQRSRKPVDAAYWMRLYFRHARSIQRAISQSMGRPAGGSSRTTQAKRLRLPSLLARGKDATGNAAFEVQGDRIVFVEKRPDPARDPEIVLSIFAAMADNGTSLAAQTETRIEEAVPRLSANLEDGPNLWHRLQKILKGRYAGDALRSMHALGILELVLPEFHGIDALVIRDAYHRYTVDEHTFVVIDTLHALGASAPGVAPRAALPFVATTKPTAEEKSVSDTGLGPWVARFGVLFRDLPHPELLLIASLLHDIGKGHTAAGHAVESARLAANVLERLELDAYETNLVLDLIRNHLEMSSALRRDVFDQETIRTFAARVPNPEALRMLALFTYADINAVHPDALTPWKAENLWRLYLATAAYLDRNVDEDRIGLEAGSELRELFMRIHSLLPKSKDRVRQYLEGFPHRYLQTRTAEVIRTHIEMAWRLGPTRQEVEVDFRYAPGISELTIITGDRPKLFSTVAGVLAGWGMNIVTADAFSNADGLAVDSFRFTDTFRTLELNETERDRFVASVRAVLLGAAAPDAMLQARRRAKRKPSKMMVQTRVDFDDVASSHSTLLQVVAQDTAGLLRALSMTLADHGCNIEVALVDTEGETAIDVFYLTEQAGKLDAKMRTGLREALLAAVEANARV